VNKPNIWAIIPAAGVGRRMKSSIPKQYLAIHQRPVIEHTLKAMARSPHIQGLVIALGDHDEYWADVELPADKPIIRARGGQERANSVVNALDALFEWPEFDAQHDWVMVHDAVRPCIRQQDISKLVEMVGDDINGGILAHPVRDTIKRAALADDQAIIETTVDRTDLWHALTPQYFPALRLHQSLSAALTSGKHPLITDESSAMEQAGYAPRLVHGHEDNIKITHPDDLRLASLFIQQVD
jgi:2-C-methyl-D-erythritol 4-phosphate cytidylyltransferase